MPSGAAERLILVDGHSLFFQVFHAIREPMTSPEGLPTNALFGFLRDLLFLRQRQPDYLICTFDRAEPTFRSGLLPSYKAQRPIPPSDLLLQLERAHRIPEALGLPVLTAAGYEADDVMATVAETAAQRGLDVLLCTADKDCRQLINDRVRIYNLRKRLEFGAKELIDEWGVRPDQVVDFQTLVGDAVDNVPGVPGIGPKTATKLLQEYGTLENLMRNVDKVPGAKKQEALRAGEANFALTRQLVRLATDVPLQLDWDHWRLTPLDEGRVGQLCQEWGFRTLAAQFRFSAPVAAPPATPVFRQVELFEFGANVAEETSDDTASEWQKDYRLVDTPEKFTTFLAELNRQPRFAFDLETTSLEPLLADPVGYAFSWNEGVAHYVAVRGPLGMPTLDPTATREQLRPLFENPSVRKVNQNIKYDLLVLRAQGVEVRGVAGDSMVADYLLNAGERSHGMEELSRRYLNHQVIPISDLIGKKSRKEAERTMDQVPTAQVAEYAGEDADVAWRLANLLEQKLGEEDQLLQLYHEVEVPLIEVLAELEYNGIRIDVELLRRISADMARQLARIEQEIYELAGRPFNIGSLVQLRQVLFMELKLPPQGKTTVRGMASTDQEALEKLAALDHPNALLPRKILEHRQISKLKGTYVDALPDLVNPRTGRVHTSFNQTVASTGRLSGSDPNLQNIPVRTAQGREIRQAFVAPPGWLLLTADYSQIELRLLAHFADDEVLTKAFIDDRDVHAAVAADIFHVPEAEVTSDQRRVAKTVNFGVLYGMSAHGLAQRLAIPREQAERFIKEYFARYPGVMAYQSRLLHDCRQKGHVATILGRRRRFDTAAIRPGSTYAQRNQTEREALNMEIQGSAADLIKLAMLALSRRLRESRHPARLLLQIHDELVLETPEDRVSDLAELVRHEMTTPLERRLKLRVPLKVDVSAGPNWLDVEEVTVV